MNLTFQEFKELAQTYNVIPLYDTFPADLDTPVTALLKLQTGEYDFLFESVVGGEKWARYSFLGTRPKKVFQLQDDVFQILDVAQGQWSQVTYQENPLEVLRNEFAPYQVYQDPELPRFFGGIVGYFGYDLVAHFDQIQLDAKKRSEIPQAQWLLTDAVVIFDNLKQVMEIVRTVIVTDRSEAALKKVYQESLEHLKNLRTQLDQPTPRPVALKGESPIQEKASMSKEQYCEVVRRTKSYIEAGDIFQGVLSMRFDLTTTGLDPLQLYRSIRRINPSPYMYYLKIKDLAVVGASPEVLVRLEEGQIDVRPIAGTRPRGKTEAEDLKLEQELKTDPKERAEHVMLVDLGRNDVGRVAQIGSVQVDESEVIERYSHVMHLVSHVSGRLAADKDVFDVIRAAFPAGTLSGAPKIRAMEIIEELEETSRGIYGGAIGYISYTQNADLAIAIRTAVVQGQAVQIQAGAGLVYNSDPESEYHECCNKAKAMIKAVKESL